MTIDEGTLRRIQHPERCAVCGKEITDLADSFCFGKWMDAGFDVPLCRIDHDLILKRGVADTILKIVLHVYAQEMGGTTPPPMT